MLSLRETFLNQFDERWRTPLLEYAKLVGALDADVVVFMARKAACLFQCFEDLKFVHSGAVHTSDLALGGRLDWLRGKRVALVDDTLISGSTLFRVAESLRTAGAASLATHVFCVDEENWVRSLAKPEPPYLKLSSHDVTSFSAQVVRAIGIVPRPYSIDFPLYNGVRLAGRSLDSLLVASGWEIDDVTSDAQAATQAVAITMSPPESSVRDLDADLGWRLSDACQLMKVRYYARPRAGARPAYFGRSLPLVALDPISHKQLEELWLGLECNLGPSIRSLGQLLPTPVERLRFVQFFASARLARIWLRDMRLAASNRRITAELDLRQVEYAFPPPARHLVQDALQSTVELPLHRTPRFLVLPLPQRPSPKSATKFKGVDLVGLQAQLTEPFLDLFREKELPSREMLRREGRRAFELPEFQRFTNRLSEGVALPELRFVLSHLNNDAAVRTLVSSFIDEAIDRGIAVPITVDDGVCVYRAYRHGEDIKFTQIEARLLCLMLEQVSKRLEAESLPKLTVEKLIVLFLRAGLSRRLLERWTGTLADRKCAGVRFYLHGAVVQVAPDKRPYHYDPGGSLTSILKGWRFLAQHGRSGYRVRVLPDRPPTTDATEHEVRAIGDIVGRVLASVPAAQRERELTLVASCLYPADVAAALAAEVSLFHEHWRELNDASDEVVWGWAEAERIIKQHDVYTAANSGLFKLRNHLEGTPAKLLEDWHSRLRGGPLEVVGAAVLASSFPTPDRSEDSRQLTALIVELAHWMFEANIALRLRRLELLAQGGAETLKERRQIEQQVAALSMESSRRLPRADQSSDQLMLDLWTSDRGADARARLMRCWSNASAVLDYSDALLSPFGRPHRAHVYRHLILVHLRGGTEPERRDTRCRMEDAIRTTQAIAISQGGSTEVVALKNASEVWGAALAVAATGQFARDLIAKNVTALAALVRSPVSASIEMWVELESDERLVRPEKSSEVTARNLEERVSAGRETGEGDRSRVRVSIITSRGEDVAAAVAAELERHSNSVLELVPARTKKLSQPVTRAYTIVDVRVGKGETLSSREECDVGIITVLPVETAAVVKWLETGGPITKVRKGGAIFYVGSTSAEGGVHRVVVTQQLQQGNRSTVSAHNRLCERFSPAMIALVGIGGSMSADVMLGDVVLADQIVWYEQATERDTEMSRKGEASNLSAPLRAMANDYFTRTSYPARLGMRGEEGAKSARLLMGPIGTGDKVIRYKESSIRTWLEGFNYKTLALETEAGGLAQGFYESGLTLGYRSLGYLVLRGISDHADKNKDDSWHEIASENAAFALGGLLQTIPPAHAFLSEAE